MKKCIVFGIILCLAFGLPREGRAQEAAAPADAALAPAPELTVIELFSSQACAFCPKADALLTNLASAPGIIALSCHVDYFDVKQGSLARPFCTARQKWYQKILATGPLYTPQMIVQGVYDVVGYRKADIKAALKKSADHDIMPLGISETEPGHYNLSLPIDSKTLPDGMTLWFAMYDKPHNITIADGNNAGQSVSYTNVISDLQDLGGWRADVDMVPPDSKDNRAGFVLLLQEKETGRIVAAGRYSF